MAETVDDLLETLNGPVSDELHAREGARLAKKHGSYKFKPLDVTKNDSTYVPHGSDAKVGSEQETSETMDRLQPAPEGYSSEGKKKSLHLDTSRSMPHESAAQEAVDTPAHEAAESPAEETAEHEEK